jgi:uncharacterized protein (TIGR03790 family)
MVTTALACLVPCVGQNASKPVKLNDRVLVVSNKNSPTSLSISKAYSERRNVKNQIQISCQDSSVDTGQESIEFSIFRKQILEPITTALKKLPNVDFIVLTKGIPIRLKGADIGLHNSNVSVDSYLACLDYATRRDTTAMVINETGWKGKGWFNRFWNSNERFSRSKFGGFLVTRLDGYTEADCKLLITNAIESEQTKPVGKILIDVASGHGVGDTSKVPLSCIGTGGSEKTLGDMGYNDWDADLLIAEQKIRSNQKPVELDNTETFVGGKSALMGYASWGSNDPKFDAAAYKSLRFAPGAIAETAVSTSARTFLPTSGGQSLIADLIRGQVTGVKGYCDEPFLQAVASPSILFDRYTRGWTLAESFYAASRLVGWQDIVIGDPICSPYASR